MKKSFTIISILLFPWITYGQYENVWAFGKKAGIDFNYNPPQTFISSIATNAGSASVCDRTGRLLFYTDGYYVWDADHNLMPNGRNLPLANDHITMSSTQGALIVPVPNNVHEYYVFSLGYDSKLYYSTIDMNLNNGRGDVVAGKKGIVLDSLLTDHMTAVRGDHCNVWLLTVVRTGNIFKAYNIDAYGINTQPVLSENSTSGGWYWTSSNWTSIYGAIDVAPNRRKVAIAAGSLSVYDFDPASGKLSNPLVLSADTRSLYTDSSRYYQMVAFSPDNTKLYGSNFGYLRLPIVVQFNLNFNNADSIIASKTALLIRQTGFMALKRGPDDKIYCADIDAFIAHMHVIKQPNLPGTDCQFAFNGFLIDTNAQSFNGLPNAIATIKDEIKSSHRIDTLSCMSDMLLRPARSSIKDVIWEDGSTDSARSIHKPGTYWVRYQDTAANLFCFSYTDSFTIVFDSLQTQVHWLQGRCAADTLELKPSQPNAPWYQWENGSTAPFRKIEKEGVYWVRYQFDPSCNVFVDTFIVQYPPKDPQVNFIADTIICIHHPFQVENYADPHFDSFRWFFGNGDSTTLRQPDYAYREKGSYEIMLVGTIGGICPDTAYQTVEVDAVIPVTFNLQPARICIGQSITFSHTLSGPQLRSLQWYFGDGTEYFSMEPKLPHAYATAGTMPVTLKARFRACPDSSDTATAYVYELPRIHLGSDQGLCLMDQPLYLRNLTPPPSDIVHYLWSTGDTTAMIRARHPGLYSLKLSTEPLGCSATESVTLSKDCYIDLPNAFSPNGDGVNDYFFPRQLLSEGVKEFKMQIWNRWGQVVFETTMTEGRGWDGKFNGENQPMGIYIYSLQWINKNGIMENDKGNVTLLR